MIHSYTSGWQGIDAIPDPPVKGAIETLLEYVQHFHVCIFSARNREPEGIYAMYEWISKWENAYWDSRPDQPRPRTALVLNLEFPRDRPSALVGIDDRVITFNGKFPSVQTIQEFRPWNNKDV